MEQIAEVLKFGLVIWLVLAVFGLGVFVWFVKTKF